MAGFSVKKKKKKKKKKLFTFCDKEGVIPTFHTSFVAPDAVPTKGRHGNGGGREGALTESKCNSFDR